MNFKNPNRVDSKIVAKETGREKVKAFVCMTAAMFLLMVTFWSMSIRGFVTESSVMLSVPKGSQLEQAEMDSYLTRSWKKQLTTERLSTQLDKLQEEIRVSHPVILGRNFERLRRSIRFDEPSRTEEGLQVQVSFEGNGAPEEARLMELIAKNFARDLAMLKVAPDESAEMLVAESAERVQSEQEQQLALVNRLVNEIDSNVEEARTAAQDFEVDHEQAMLEQKRANTALINRAQAMVEKAARMRAADSDGDAELGLDEQRELLTSKLEVLRTEQKSAEDSNDDNELARIKDEKNDVLMKLATLEDDWKARSNEEASDELFEPGQLDDPLPGFDESPSMSPFKNVSNIRPLPKLDRVNSALDKIDVIALKSTVGQVENSVQRQSELHAQQVAIHKMAAKAQRQVFVVEGVVTEKSKPIGGMPTGSTLFSIILLSLIVGSVVAWNFQPELEYSGFGSADELSKVTGVPVLASLVRRSEESEDDSVPMSNLTVSLAKIVLLAILVVIAGGLAMSSEAREAFGTNPFYGLSQIMWNLLGK